MAEPKTERREWADTPVPPLMGRGGPPHMRMLAKVEHAKDSRGAVLRLWGYLRRQRASLIATALTVVATTEIGRAHV